jgi:hypothetical protein
LNEAAGISYACRHLDIHDDEVGAIGFGLGDAGLAISGLDDGVP